MLRVQKGDQKAFALLYERYKRPLLSFAYSFVGEQNRSEDIVQEVFLRAYRARETWVPTAQVSTWLWTIARNTSIDFLRRHKKEALSRGNSGAEAEGSDGPDWSERIESPLPDAEAQLMEHADRARVEDCLSKLPAKQKEVLLLRTQSELPYEEIARIAETSLQAVKSLLFRAKQGLLNCLGLKATQEGASS